MEFHMRNSRVLRKMREGKVATCTKINLSDLRNCEIAAMCGFENNSYFSKMFKRVMGCLPSEVSKASHGI